MIRFHSGFAAEQQSAVSEAHMRRFYAVIAIIAYVDIHTVLLLCIFAIGDLDAVILLLILHCYASGVIVIYRKNTILR